MERKINILGRNFDYVYFDTNSLMRPQFAAFMRMIIPDIKEAGRPAIIIQAVMNELRALSHRDDQNTATSAQKALEEIAALSKVNVIAFKGNPNDKTTIPDSLFLEAAVHARYSGEHILFVSQDFQLAKELLGVNQLSSTKGSCCNVLKINRYAMLEEFDFSESRPTFSFRSSSVKPAYDKKTAEILKRFGL